MSLRRLLRDVLLFSALFAATSTAQPADRNPLAIKARVLDLVFPLHTEARPPYLKMILRFGDSDTQTTILVYPGGESELVHNALEGTNGKKLSEIIDRMVAQNPDVQDREIAARIRVKTTRSTLEYKELDQALKDLKAIKISPFLSTRVALDEVSQYDFWFSSGQESVHYTVYGPFDKEPQDQLVQWMIRFRSSFP